MTRTPTAPKISVLAYHRLGEPGPDGWDTWYQIPTETFRKQMAFLKESGWAVIDAGTFIRALTDPGSIQRPSVLITFDDGCRSIVEIAKPILREFGYPAVLFVPTNYIGKTSSFDREREPEVPICTWKDLKALEEADISIQSHGVSHYWYSLLDSDDQKKELSGSKQKLENRLNKEVELYAFPYSDDGWKTCDASALLEQAGYRSAFLCGGGPATFHLPVEDPFRVSRIAMFRDTDLDSLLGKA